MQISPQHIKISWKNNLLTIIFVTFTSLLSLAFTTVKAENAVNPTAPAVPTPINTNTPFIIPNAPQIDAKGWILMDANSGQILTGNNIHQHLQPASLTKLMSVFVASQALRQGQIHMTDMVHISTKAWQMEGSRMFLKVNTDVSVEDLIKGIIVASGNDACVALAEHVAGSEDSFANLMNQTATSLGMKDTHYMDSTGMPSPDHYSTPYDLAILSRNIINNYPEDYQWYKQKWITYNGIKQPNRNRLLWSDSSVDGLKTGHTDSAGFCLIASAKRNNMRLISVVMGAPSDSARADDTRALLEWGFRFYETHQLFDSNKPLTSMRIWYGKDKSVAMGLTSPLYITIPIGQYKNLKANMQVAPDLQAPIIKGKNYGQVQVRLQDKVIATAPLVALDNVPLGSTTQRLSDRLVIFIHKIL